MATALAILPEASPKPQIEDFSDTTEFLESLSRWVFREERAGERHLALVPKTTSPVTLYAAEESLLALADSAETVTPEQETEFLADFSAALNTAVDKRDRVGQFLVHLDSQVELARKEIARLQERKRSYELAQERVERYVIATIEQLGPDPKGKFRKLEGKTVTLSLRACPASVDVKDETVIPAEFKTITVSLPAPAWEEMLDALDLEQRATVLDQVRKADCAVSKTALKQAIEGGRVVPGADLAIGKHSLVIR